MPRSADSMLMGYVEARERLSSAPALAFTLHDGLVLSLFCEAKRSHGARTCAGVPRKNVNGEWFCSVCHKAWHFESVQLGRTQIGGKVAMWGRDRRLRQSRTAPRDNESRSHRALREFGPVLEQVAHEDPYAFTAWRLHVLSDEGIRLGWPSIAGARQRATALGAPQEQIPRLMEEIIAGGLLAPVDYDFTAYRVRIWLGSARRRAIEIHEERVRSTIAKLARHGIR